MYGLWHFLYCAGVKIKLFVGFMIDRIISISHKAYGKIIERNSFYLDIPCTNSTELSFDKIHTSSEIPAHSCGYYQVIKSEI